MTLADSGSHLTVADIAEITAVNCTDIRDKVLAALRPGLTRIDFDFSAARFIDSSGLGSLVSVQRQAAGQNVKVRLLAPNPQIRQLLQLTQMQQLFEIV